MTFFYDLNKKLNTIRELPETTHRQLNESAAKKSDAKDLAKGSAKQKPDYKSKMQDKFGGSAADLTRGLSIKSKKVDEGNYTKDAMELNPDFAKVGKKPGVMGKIAQGVKRVADFVAPGDEDLLRDLERKTGGRRPAKVAEETGLNKSVEAASKIINKTDPYSEHVGSLGSNHVFFSGSSGSDEHIYHIFNDKTKETDTVSFYHEGTPQSLKDIAAAVYDYSIAKIIHGHHKDNLDESANLDNVRFGEGAAPMTPKQKSFAKLAPPADKITFADKIAGAKKEVDEMLGDVAAEAMKAALGKQQVRGMGEATREIPGGRRHTAGPGGYGRKDDEDAPRVQTQRGRGRPKKNADSETGQVMKPDWSAFGVGKVNLPKHKGAVTKHKMVGEESDPQTWTTIEDVEFIEDLMDRAFEAGSNALGNTLQGVLEKIKYNQDDGEQMNEKAVSKKQQRFMGMVHAAKKGEKPASKEVARAAKGISAKEADKFASTKHKGLPEKAKEDTDTRDTKAEKAGKKVTKDIEYDEKAKDGDHGKKRGAQDAKAEKAGKKVAKDIEHDEKVDENTTSGSVATAPAAGGKKSSGGFNFGGGIYDSMNRDLENMISESMNRLDESMNISMNMNSDSHGGPTKSLTITATDDDADKLAMMLKMAGMGGDHDHGQAYADAPDMVDENKPDWPTNTETSDDAFQYSGGLNKPKRDVAGDGQATGQVTAVSSVDHDDEHDDKLSEASDSDMADRVRDLVGDFDRNMTQMRVYGDPDVDRAIAYLKQGDAEAAVEVVVDTYGTQDGGEFRNMSDYAQDLLGDFESLIGSGQDDLARMMEMAGVSGQQLDEGVMDKIKGLVPRFMQMVGADTAAEIAKQVKQVTGGDYSLTQDNAVKVAKAFGLDKMQPPGDQGQQQMAEGIAGNWQGKLLQLIHAGTIGGGIAHVAMGGSPFGGGLGAAGVAMAIAGGILLLFANTFWSSRSGMIGSMGRFGNKGTSTYRGLDPKGNIETTRYGNEEEDDYERRLQAMQKLGEDDLARMMEMAGVKKKAVDEEKTEEGNKFTGNLAKARAAGKKEADLDGDGDMEKVQESIFDLQRLWKAYKG